MKTLRYVQWRDGEMWLGHLEDYPDYWTQGESLEELEENLRDIHRDVPKLPDWPIGLPR